MSSLNDMSSLRSTNIASRSLYSMDNGRNVVAPSTHQRVVTLFYVIILKTLTHCLPNDMFMSSLMRPLGQCSLEALCNKDHYTNCFAICLLDGSENVRKHLGELVDNTLCFVGQHFEKVVVIFLPVDKEHTLSI